MQRVIEQRRPGDYSLANRLDGLNVRPIRMTGRSGQSSNRQRPTGSHKDRVGDCAEGQQPPANRQKGGAPMLTLLQQFNMWLTVRRGNDEGATAVEYGLMVALIAGAIVGVVFALGGSLSDLFGAANDK